MEANGYVIQLCCVLFLSRVILSLGYKFPIITEGARLVDPPARSSLWREGISGVYVNPFDHRQNCGGVEVQWRKNQGRCGVCGDPWSAPREHELGGKYDSGHIARVYRQNSTLLVTSLVSDNLTGWFEFRLFPNSGEIYMTSSNNDYLLPVAHAGNWKYNVFTSGYHVIPVQLPAKTVCDRCTFQWKFQTGILLDRTDFDAPFQDSFDDVNKEQYYGCSDVSIVGAEQLSKFSTLPPLHANDYKTWWCQSQCMRSECESCQSDVINGRHKRAAQTCYGIAPYNNAQMTEWCTTNCAHNFCPGTHCKCSSETTISWQTTSTSRLPTSLLSSLSTLSLSTSPKATSTAISTVKSSTSTKMAATSTESTTTTVTSPIGTSMSSTSTDSLVTSDHKLSTTSVTKTTDTMTSLPASNPPDIVQVLSTLGCSYCKKTNNDGCQELLCQGYNKLQLDFRGSITERLQQLSGLFCSYCGAEVTCRVLFCPQSYFLVSRALTTRCKMCQKLNDTTCLQDQACLGTSALSDVTTEGINPVTTTTRPITSSGQTMESSTEFTNTDISVTSTTTKKRGQSTCKSSKLYAGNAGMDAWCEVNCKASPPNCPKTHCTCTGENGLDVQLLNVEGNNCVAQPYLDPMVTGWCRNNCPLYCPSSHCVCSYQTTQTQPSTTTSTTSQTTNPSTTTRTTVSKTTLHVTDDVTGSVRRVCRATPDFSVYANMDEWCMDTCKFYCPPEYCLCQMVYITVPTETSTSTHSLFTSLSSISSSLSSSPSTSDTTFKSPGLTSSISSIRSSTSTQSVTADAGFSESVGQTTSRDATESPTTHFFTSSVTSSSKSTATQRSNMTTSNSASDGNSVTTYSPFSSTIGNIESTTDLNPIHNVSTPILMLQNILCSICTNVGDDCTTNFCSDRFPMSSVKGIVNRRFATMLQCSFYENTPRSEIFCYGDNSSTGRYGGELDDAIDETLCYSCLLTKGENCSPVFC